MTSQDDDEKTNDESVSKVDKSPAEEEEVQCNIESFDLPVEFEDPMFELMKGKMLEGEYNKMTLEQEEQLTPKERMESGR